jgi:AcrR family transcriptional regulator
VTSDTKGCHWPEPRLVRLRGALASDAPGRWSAGQGVGVWSGARGAGASYATVRARAAQKLEMKEQGPSRPSDVICVTRKTCAVRKLLLMVGLVTETSPARELAVRPPLRRRDLQKEQTRHDLALAAFQLAMQRGLAKVRVPEIAAAVGVSTRTFNNYFASKEQAVAWLSGRHARRVAAALHVRPAGEPLGDALIAAVTGQYRPPPEDGLPPHFLRDFRALVAREPGLHGEHLSALAVAERELADVIATRMPDLGQLQARVLAAMVSGAERAALIYWMETRSGSLAGTVRAAVEQATAGVSDRR